jgi:hypothetical protein
VQSLVNVPEADPNHNKASNIQAVVPPGMGHVPPKLLGLKFLRDGMGLLGGFGW